MNTHIQEAKILQGTKIMTRTSHFISRILVVLFAVVTGLNSAAAQSFPNAVFKEVYEKTPVTPQCSNAGFEAGLADWISFRAKRTGISTAYETKVGPFPPTLSSTCLLPQSNQGHLATTEACHVIESAGTDLNLPSAGHPKTQEGAMSLRLGGNAFAPANKHSAGGLIEGTAKRFIVQSANSIYQFRYSSVMNKAHDSSINFTGEEPYFQAIAIDPTTGAIIDKFVQPASGYNPNFVLSADKPVGYDNSPTANEPIMFSAWSCAKLDLSSHVGKEVIIYFVNSDCVHTGHPAYTYVDDTCADCKKPEDVGITLDPTVDLKICEPDKKTKITGKVLIPTGVIATNVAVKLDVRQGGSIIKTLSNGVIVGSAYSFDLAQPDLNGLGCYDIVATLEYDVKTPAGNIVHVVKATSIEGTKPGKDNDFCVVDCKMDPPVEKACLSSDPKVTCGKAPGTYVITLNPTGVGGIVPTSLNITSLTLGVTIVSPQATYPVIGGQVKITLAGAVPGQVIDLDVEGTTQGAGSAEGLDLCCNGKIKVTIPTDLECPPPILVSKICDVAKHVWIGDLPPRPNMPPNGYVAMCHIKVATTGSIPNPINISEVMNGAGTVTYAGSSDPWSCIPPMVPGNTPMNCTLPGNTMTGPSDTSTIDVKVTFANAGAVEEATNCASATYGKSKIKRACDDFDISKSTVNVVKKCESAVFGKYPVSQVATGLGYHANCTLTLTTTGPQTSPITVGDTLAGTGTIVNMTAPAPWVCTTPTCSINGTALNQTTSTTIIGAIAVFANAGDAMEAKNCAKVAVAGKPADESCVPIVVKELGKLTVAKEASYNGTHITNVNFPIAVTCGGTTTNATFADSAPYVQSNVPVGANCSVIEGTAPLTGLCKKSQTEVWTTTYNPTTPVAATVAGATINVRNILSCKDDAESTIKVTKTCDPVEEVIGAINSYVADCKITVTTTGPQSAPITVNEVMSGGGTAVSAVSSTTPAWTCSPANCSINGGLLNQATSTSVIDVKVSFPSKGHALESQNCANVAVGQNPVPKPDGESCTKFTVDGDKFKLDVKKDCSGVVALTANGPWAGYCKITVTATGGPRPPFIAFTEQLSDSNALVSPAFGTSGQQSADPWGCSATSAAGPVSCVIAGNAFPASGTSEILIPVQVPLGIKPGEARNCVIATGAADVHNAAPSSPPVSSQETCVPLPGGPDVPPPTPATLSVTKTCDPAVQVPGSNRATAVCHITVTGTGTLPPVIAVNETLNGLGNPANQITAMTSAQNWTYPALPVADGVTAPITINSADLMAAGGTSIIDVTVQLFDLGTAMESQNCVEGAGGDGLGQALIPPLVSPRVCVPLIANSAKPTVAVEKTCAGNPQAADIDNDGIHDTFTCQIKVTVTGVSGNVFIEDMVADATNNLAGVATIQSMTSTDPWDCSWVGPIEGSLSADYCTIPVSSISGGTSIINVVMADSPEPNAGPHFNCARHTNWPGMAANPDNSNSSCVRIDGLIANLKIPPLVCDPATATNAGDLCRCRFDNMNPVSKTACECNDGFTLKAGQGCVRKVVEPKCDLETTVTKGGKCVCEYKNMVQTSASACACAKGFKFAPGKGCFKPEPVCKQGQRFQPARGRCEPVCAKGFEYSVKRNLCNPVRPVCGKGTAYNAKRNRCDPVQPVCRPPFVYNAKINKCVEVIKRECGRGQISVKGRCINIPKCGFGQIPIPGTGVCVSIGGGGGGDTDPPKCVPTATRACK